MATAHQVDPIDTQAAGARAYQLIRELFPICRSITGEGNRQTLRKLRELIPIEIHEVPSGAEAFDWTVPKEWNIRDASIRNLHGERLIDFRKCNLHVVSYSTPINMRVSLEELKSHVITEPKYPDWVPYRTAYYAEKWGFCLSHNQLLSLTDPEYDVTIDSTLQDGSLTYGELLLPGESSDEILISTHICHPSLCNDNLSGISVAMLLAQALQERPHLFSYRFLFVPGNIGSIVWLARNEERVDRIKHGLILSNMGDSGSPVYKKSRRGDAEVDRAMANVLKHSGQEFRVIEFSPYGYDERQYCSPGFNLPVGRLSRTPHGEFPEYHTSADNLDLVKPEYLADSFAQCLSLFEVLEGNRRYLNLKPKCEPRLGKRNLYGSVGGARNFPEHQLAILWVLNQSDGSNSLLDISERSGLAFPVIKAAADALAQTDLLREVSP
jgi:aminopeptidase-like protein